jgi:hypothetical protein
MLQLPATMHFVATLLKALVVLREIAIQTTSTDVIFLSNSGVQIFDENNSGEVCNQSVIYLRMFVMT